MIDTIKLKIPLTPLILLSIQDKCFKEMSERGSGKGTKLFSHLIVPPENRILTVIKDYDYPIPGKKVPNPDKESPTKYIYYKTQQHPNMYFYVEGSLPKLEYGENVRLLYPQQLPAIFRRIEEALKVQYGDVPSWERWEVQRIDPVYEWRYADGEESNRVLAFLETLEYKRKKGKLSYEGESVIFVGRAFSIKFYLKEPELKKHSKGISEEILQLSKGVVRYELKLHKSKLVTLFKDKSIKTIDILNLQWYYDILNDCLSELLRNKNKVSSSDEEAAKKLLDCYAKAKAFRLFYFWKTYYSRDNHIKKFLKKNNSSTTLLRNFKALEYACVGVPTDNSFIPFDLSIPNKNVVTPEPTEPIAIASGQSRK